ncbi:unnamed protein product [Echinostoma caproni]|uniref:LisH domain-containing protein n=1 Tax=Echinostoma caproni TaxID=27848 RepID=A0A183ALZ6_9TREM|nr:unnamed protein product [Echinostoma caproni]
MSDEDADLKDVLVRSLNETGILPRLQAQLRAAVYLALEKHNYSQKIPPANAFLRNICSTEDGNLAVHGYDQTVDESTRKNGYRNAVASDALTDNDSQPSSDRSAAIPFSNLQNKKVHESDFVDPLLQATPNGSGPDHSVLRSNGRESDSSSSTQSAVVPGLRANDLQPTPSSHDPEIRSPSLGNDALEVAESFVYLGRGITTSRGVGEISQRVIKARLAFANPRHLLRRHDIPFTERACVLRSGTHCVDIWLRNLASPSRSRPTTIGLRQPLSAQHHPRMVGASRD